MRFTRLLMTAALLLPASVALGQGASTFPTRVDERHSTQERKSAERLAELLKKSGSPVNQVQHADGATTLKTKLKMGTWRYVLDVECAADGKSCKLICPLCNPSKFSSDRLLKLLGHKGRCGHFTFRPADSMLCFENPSCVLTGSDDDFQRSLDDFLAQVRESFPLWSGRDNDQKPADEPMRRTVWRYDGGTVKYQGKGFWIENRDDGSTETFKEVTRTAEWIDLFDETRGYTVRIAQGEWFIQGGTAEGFRHYKERTRLGAGSWAE